MLDISVSLQMKEEPRRIEAMAEENHVLGRVSSDSNANRAEYVTEWWGTRVFHGDFMPPNWRKSTHLTGVFCLKLSCSIIYSHSLSLGFGPLGGGGLSLYPLVLAVTCMEQLNAQKLATYQGKPWKPSAGIFAATPRGAASSCRCQMLLMRLCLCFSSLSFTHLWTWCMTGRGWCQPGVGGEERKAKKWKLPWSVSSSFLGLLHSHALGNVTGARHCLKDGTM